MMRCVSSLLTADATSKAPRPYKKNVQFCLSNMYTNSKYAMFGASRIRDVGPCSQRMYVESTNTFRQKYMSRQRRGKKGGWESVECGTQGRQNVYSERRGLSVCVLLR